MNFLKKKKEESTIPVSYTTWSDDLGFLFFIMERKKSIRKDYVITLLSSQLEPTDFLNDEMVMPHIEECVAEIMQMISVNYKQFLIIKYFGSEDALLNFITEDVYNDFIKNSVKVNSDKIIKKAQSSNILRVQRQNTQN